MTNDKAANVENNKKEQGLKILELYLEEWKHRDSVYHKFATTFYFCAVVVSLFPYVKFVEDYTLSINNIVFAIAGTLIALLTSLTIFGMSLRNTKVYDKYDSLLGQININFKQFDSNRKLKISLVLPWIFFALILALNITLVFTQ